MSNTVIPWSTLTPNQRDALIAEHIFDRKVVDWRPGRALLLEREGQPGLHESVPAYTESMDEAWKVLQKMCDEEEWTEQMMLFINYLDDGEVVDRNVTRSEPLFTLLRLAKLSPAMICSAALRSLGLIIEIEEKP